MTRVLLWHWGRRGGGPRYTFELARALAARGDVEVHLSLSRQSEWFAASQRLGLPGCHVDTYTGVPGFLTGSLRLPMLRRRLGRYLREHRIDVVLCTMVHVWNVAMLGAIRDAGCRYVFTVHDAVLHPGEENRLRDWALDRELAAADSIVTLTDHVRRSLVERRNVDPARISVIPHGVFDCTAGIAGRAPLPPPLRLLFFGRILHYKGIDILLDAYQTLRRSGIDVHLTIAGQGALSRYVRRAADLDGVTVVNDWIGEDEIGRIVAQHHVLVQPYREASQSGVIPVAFAAGLASVVTPVGGLTEQVSDGVDGLVAESVSSDSVVKCIARLAVDADLVARLGAGARNTARTRLSWPVIAQQFAELVASR
jgi:glycosyltransferase involved in cell wall biosynthesis